VLAAITAAAAIIVVLIAFIFSSFFILMRTASKPFELASGGFSPALEIQYP